MLRSNYMLLEGLTADGSLGGTTAAATTAATAATAAAEAAATAAGSGGGFDWEKFSSSLPEELRKDPSMSVIKDPTSLVKSYISSQKMVGKERIAIPDAKHATEQDWLQTFRKLGAPDKAENYNFKLPDGVDEKTMDPTLVKSIKEAAVQAGVMPHQLEKVFGSFYAFSRDKMAESEQAAETKHAKDLSSLKEAWGPGYDENVKRANIAFRELVPDQGERERLVADGLGAHPVVMKLLAKASSFFKDDTFRGHGDGVLGNMTPAEAQARASEIMGNSQHPYRVKTHPGHQAAKDEVSGLFKIMHPEGS